MVHVRLDGKPLWLVVAATKTAPSMYTGTLYTGTGPAVQRRAVRSGEVVRRRRGPATLTFADGNNATFAYSVDGERREQAVTRQVFAAPGTTCQ